MIKPPESVKQYGSAEERFLKPLVMNFFARECPKLFGPLIRERFTDGLISLFEAAAPHTSRLESGQLLWNALDKNTRGDSPRRRYVPVILTIISAEDVRLLTKGVSMSQIAQGAIARMIREAYQQGGILSTRDLSLLTLRHPSNVSKMRRQYEARHRCTLPHTGALHDMGSCVSHKTTIVRKVILEKRDPATVARECNHSQTAVDRYLKNYHRVKTLYELGHDIQFIHLVTSIAKHTVTEYIKLVDQARSGRTQPSRPTAEPTRRIAHTPAAVGKTA